MKSNDDIKMSIELTVTATSTLGVYNIADEGKVRVVVENAGGGNAIVVSARIIGQTAFVPIATFTGLANDVVNVSTYDEIKIECTTYSSLSDHIKVIAGSFNAAGGSTIESIDVPSGDTLTDLTSFEFISSDSSVVIEGDNVLKQIDFRVVSSPPVGYQQIFNSTTDWGAPSGGFYSIVITAATHGQGSRPIVQIYQGTEEVDIFVNNDALGNVTIKVSQSPDQRFSGKINIK